ncbi:MAG: hypothetical protein P8049_03155 [Gemmatimonadota bacterium]
MVATLLFAVSELKRTRAVASTDIETILFERMLGMDRLVVENGDFAQVLVCASENPRACPRVTVPGTSLTSTSSTMRGKPPSRRSSDTSRVA